MRSYFLIWFMVLASTPLFAQDAVERRYAVPELRTQVWWAESCEFDGCSLASGGPVEATFAFPEDVRALHMLRLEIAGSSSTGCWQCVESCESPPAKRCHEDPLYFSWIRARILDPCGRVFTTTHQPVDGQYWFWEFTLEPAPAGDCAGDLGSLLNGEFSIVVDSEPTSSSPAGYWDPDPAHEILGFHLVAAVEIVVETDRRTWGVLKAGYD